MKEEVKSLITTLIVNEPFIGLLLKRTWIYESREVNAPAWTDGLRVFINPELFSKFDDREKPYILAHEVMHIIQKHVPRTKQLIKKYPMSPTTYNVVSDAKVNQYLHECRDIKKPNGVIEPLMLRDVVSDPYGMSFEEIIEELWKKAKKVSIKPQWGDVSEALESGEGGEEEGEDGEDEEDEGDGGKARKDEEKEGGKSGKGGEERKGGNGRGRGKTDSEGRVLNEGDEEDRGARSDDEIERRAEKKVVEVAVSIKSIGKLPAWAERLVNEILKPKVDWRRLIRSALTKGLGKKVKRTWTRPSRKYPAFPGKETLKMQKVVCLIDTSGSIGEKELKQFISEVYGIAKEVAEVIVIPWDARAYDPIIIKRNSDISKIVLKGGGGTMIMDALELVDRRYSDANIIVILSDWLIGDLSTDDVQRLLRKYSNRIVAVTTADQPPKYLKSIKIQF